MVDATVVAAGASGAGAAAAAVIANAIKASGAIVHVEFSDFKTVLQLVDAPLVVRAQVGGVENCFQE